MPSRGLDDRGLVVGALNLVEAPAKGERDAHAVSFEGLVRQCKRLLAASVDLHEAGIIIRRPKRGSRVADLRHRCDHTGEPVADRYREQRRYCR